MSSAEKQQERNMPEHIAIIMDGNGRWATKRGKPRLAGHEAGHQALERIVRVCSDEGVKYLTVYAFSTENWKRPALEVNGIFKLLVLFSKKDLKELKENNVRIQALGELDALPSQAAKSLRQMIEETKDNTGMVLSACINYGSRQEITRAVRSIIRQYREEGKDLPSDEEITEELVNSGLYTADMPDPDLIIRTGGEKRISNFLLWQCAYSEFVFSDVLWPDFGKEELMQCVDEFYGRHRRFGGLDKE